MLFATFRITIRVPEKLRNKSELLLADAVGSHLLEDSWVLHEMVKAWHIPYFTPLGQRPVDGV